MSDNTQTINLPDTSVDIGKALKLRLQGGLTYQQIADVLGTYKTTIVRALKPFLALIKNPEALQVYKDNRAALLNAAEMTLLSSALRPDKINKASSRDMVVSFGIVTDKRRLEEDKSTSNVSVSHALQRVADSMDAIDAELADLEGGV